MKGINRNSYGQSDPFIRWNGILQLHLSYVVAQIFSALLSRLKRGIWHDQDELLAAVTAGDILTTDMALEESAKLAQKYITCCMTIGIIEVFEVINVYHNDT